MATTTGTHVNFVKVPTMTKFNDITTKADGTIYFIVDAKKIYLDGVLYGFNDSDVDLTPFLKLIGGTMSGDIDMGDKNIKNINELEFKHDSLTTTLGQYVDGFVISSPNLAVQVNPSGINLIGGTNPKISGLADPTANNQAVTLNYLKENVINKIGVGEGIASLDIMGKVPSSQLPSYVDDVVEYSDKASFPATGESGKLYIDLSNNNVWRWSGSAYVNVSDGNAHLTLGTTASTAYQGNLGKIAYDHSQLESGNPHKVTKANVGLGNVQNYGIATEAQATAGVGDVYMTPQRTAQAITAIAPRLSWTVVA